MAVELTGPTGNKISVPDESADYWRSLGFAEAKGSDKKAPAKKSAAKKSSK